MKRTVFVCVIAIVPLHVFCQTSTARPRITGIDHVAFYTTQAEGVNQLYIITLGLTSADPVESGETARYMAGRQWIGYSPAPDPKATDRMDHVAFTTENIVALRRYLVDKGLKPAQIEGRSDHSLSFTIKDPEGHKIEFVERGKGDAPAVPGSAVSHRMIHVGFLVQSREAENHFYLEILGFRPYWHGG